MILGADPGKYGGIALYSWRLNSVSAYRIPIFQQIRKDKKSIHRIDAAKLLALVIRLSDLEPTAVIIEDVTGFSDDGASRAFQFGRAVGQLEMALVAAGHPPPQRIAPSVWKPALGVPADKKGAIDRASALMPGGAKHWKTHDGMAEAALIAYYGAHFMGLADCPVANRKRPRVKLTPGSLSRVLQPV